MTMFTGLASFALIVLVLVDAFETAVLPRRVTHRFRFVRLFYLTNWHVWRAVALRSSSGQLARGVPELFWPVVAVSAAGLVGGGARFWVRAVALVAGHGDSFAGKRAEFIDVFLLERRHVFYARTR